MPTEELKFEDLLKEYIEVVESTDINKLKEENKVIKVDIERKGKEEKDIDARIEQIQAELDSLNENSTVKLEYPEAIKNKEDKLKEAKDFKENKGKEIKELKDKTKENNKQIRKVNNIGKDVIKRAEEKTNKENEEIEKKIEELEERKAKYGIKRIYKDGKEDIQYTKEEQIVVDSINKEISKLRREIIENKRALLDFRKTIEAREVIRKEKTKPKRKARKPKKEEQKEKPEQEKKDEQKPEKTDEKPEKTDDTKHEEIPVTPTEKTSERTGNNNPAPKQPTGKTEKKKDEEEPIQEPTEENEGKEENGDKPSREEKVEDKGKVIPGVPQPEYEVHEVKDSEEDKDIFSNSYNKVLSEYKDKLSLYKDAFLVLGDLQQQYENGEIPYSEYEKQALEVSKFYKVMLEEYAKVKERYDIEKAKEDKFANITNEDLENKLKELDEETTELWQQGVHENTPDAKRYHEALAEIKKIKEELKQREENPLRGMSLEELEAKKHELYARIGEQQEPDEYHFRTHEENGLEGYEDEIDKGLREIREEIERRQPKLEAPEEPFKPGMILEKDREEDEIEEEKGSNLPVRSFWEIYSETNSEHASNLAIKLHNFAHMKLLPRKEEDTATKLLSVPLLPIKLVMKLGSWLPNKLMGTDKKLKEMQENIDELSPEEFQVLVSSADKVNEMFGDTVKDSFDSDYLDPQFMKQHKVNELYLKAVGSRLTRERQAGIEYCNEQILEYDSRLKELEKISEDRELTPDEILEYNGLTQAKQELTQQGKDLRQEIDTFNDGVKKKSSAFKNIRGWFLGKFNPDTRKADAHMAELSKKRREASKKGDTKQINMITNQMKDYEIEQTKIVGLGNDKIDRGVYSIEGPIEMLDRGEENRGRLLLTDAAILAAAIDLVQQVKQNMTVTKDVTVSGEAKVSELDGAKEAQEGIARQTVEGTFNRNERANLDANNWRLDSSGYRAGDAITHAEGGQAAQAVQAAIARGDSEGALRIATDYFQRNAAKDEAAIGAYAQNHTFDYTAINFGGAKDAQAIMDFFGGTVKFSDTVKVTIDGINSGINPLAAIFAGANAMHQAQKQGVRDGFKEALRKGAKRKKEKTKTEETPEKETNGRTTQKNTSKEDGR